jgi:stage II sporulation protein D
MRRKRTAAPMRYRALNSLLIIIITSAAVASDKPEIRVLLEDIATTVTVAGVLAWSSGGKNQGSSRGEARVSLVGDQVNARWDDKSITSPKLAAAAMEGHLHYGGRQYRGRLEFFASRSGGLAVLNVLPLEEYLLGVVSAEMPSSWPAEALRAQAIVARSYAVTRMANRREATYDVLATTSDQVYRGVSAETPQTDQAVHDTSGQILTYNGEPIVAYYCADAGGYTRAGEAPYLRSVPCPSPRSPHSQWEFQLSNAELAELSAAAGSMVGVVNEVTTRHDSVSGHLLSITLCGNLGTCLIDGPRLRRFIGRDVMKSTRRTATSLK